MRDALLILGGGVRQGGALPPWAEARFDLALELAGGEPLVCLSAGTTHRPPPLEDGFPITESEAGARYLLGRGVPPSRIRIENLSHDTVGNAYFAKLLHVDPPRWRHLLVITSEFHMRRTEAIFRRVFGFEPGRYTLDFAAAENRGMGEDVVRSRGEKEAASLEQFESEMRLVGSLIELHEWLFTRHSAYAPRPHRSRAPSSQDPRLLESY